LHGGKGDCADRLTLIREEREILSSNFSRKKGACCRKRKREGRRTSEDFSYTFSRYPGGREKGNQVPSPFNSHEKGEEGQTGKKKEGASTTSVLSGMPAKTTKGGRGGEGLVIHNRKKEKGREKTEEKGGSRPLSLPGGRKKRKGSSTTKPGRGEGKKKKKKESVLRKKKREISSDPALGKKEREGRQSLYSVSNEENAS